MPNNSVNTEQVVVSNGIIVAVWSFTDDLVDIYDHVNYTFFDYNTNQVGIADKGTVSISDNALLTDTSGSITSVSGVTVTPINIGAPDPRLTMTLPNAKVAVISQLNRILAHNIQAIYPTQTQLDIIRVGAGYTSSDLTTMSTAIDGLKAAIIAKIAAVNALSTVSAVIAYNVWA